MKSSKDKEHYSSLKEFFKAVLDIRNHAQVIKIYIKGKLHGQVNLHDEVGAGDNLEPTKYNLKKKVIFQIDPKTGKEIEVPMSEKLLKLFKEQNSKNE